ncbi:hypothetical protein AAVH_17643 [Aphelenchoides avenae]|nr:hypothetical protein AAVH_17643 [Aphelenchus avenae]
MRRRPLVFLLFSFLAYAAAQDDRIIDVKQIIKDTLDVMRSYPPPPILTQPQTMMALTQQTPIVLPEASQMASVAVQQMPQQAPLQALQSAARYGQALPVAVATTQPVHQAMVPQPLAQPPTQQEQLPQRSYGPAAVAHGVSTYGGQRYYGSAIQQNTAIYNSKFREIFEILSDGTEYNPYTAASSQSPALPRIFATPTQTDLERLFHLPADIMHRLAADAGYIDPDPELYSKYSSSSSGNSGSGGLSGFNFNVQDGSKPAVSDIASFFLPQATTAAPRPVIVAAGTPKITTRTAVRNGKTVELPMMIVPLRNGQTASIPYENLHDLSEAVHKIITTGELTLPETTPKSSSPEQTPPAPIDHIQIEPPTTTRPTVASTKKVVRTESNAFVQEIDDTTTPAPTTTSPPTRATPPPASPTIGQEIVLNGLRYKLVDNVTGGGSNRPRLRLKSAPTRVAPGG